jgi:hypothetical protein
MAFIKNGSNVISFAEYDDVIEKDQRLFDSNEGLTSDVIEDLLIRSTERILTQLRASVWWQHYYTKRDSSTTYATTADIPALNINKIVDRENDFTDLCVYYALYDYVLPKIADFGTEENAERAKITYYQGKYDRLFGELITAGDWYDFDGSGAVASSEKDPGVYNLKRVR